MMPRRPLLGPALEWISPKLAFIQVRVQCLLVVAKSSGVSGDPKWSFNAGALLLAHERADGQIALLNFISLAGHVPPHLPSPLTSPPPSLPDGPRDDVGISVGGWNCGSALVRSRVRRLDGTGVELRK